MDSTSSPKVKTLEKKGVGARSLVCNTLRIKGHVGVLGQGIGRLMNKKITHTDLHKPNNKLVST
jgi:hypothetical protein